MNEFQNRLRQAMKEKNISQAELARRTNIGRNSISDYLNGKYEAKQDKVYLLANALGVDEGWLIGFDTSKEKVIADQPSNPPKNNETSEFAEVLAAHIDKDATEEEIEEILAYIEMKRNLRRNKKK